MRKPALILILVLAVLVQLSYAGDVVYTMWEDDGGQLWVRIQNDTSRTIQVESIRIASYDKKGKRLNDKEVPCAGNCRLAPHDTRDFGPYSPPQNSESSRVQNVRYNVE